MESVETLKISIFFSRGLFKISSLKDYDPEGELSENTAGVGSTPSQDSSQRGHRNQEKR